MSHYSKVGSRRVHTSALAVGVALAVAGLSACGQDGSSSTGDRGSAAPAAKPRQVVSSISPTYEGIGGLKASADVIVRGTVVRSTVVEPAPLEPDADGARLSGIPFTDYDLAVDRVDKGDSSLSGRTVTVRILGGETADANYVVENAPALQDGSSYVFFLRAGEGGVYFPLAGDAAVATKTASGAYQLPADVVSAEAATIPASEIDPPGPGGPTTTGSAPSTTPGGGGAEPTAPSAPIALTPPTAAKAFRLTLKQLKVGSVVRRGAKRLALRITGVPAGTRVEAKLSVTVTVRARKRSSAQGAKRSTRRTIVIAKKVASVGTSGSAAITIPISARARRSLRTAIMNSGRLTVKATTRGGAASTVVKGLKVRR